MKYRRQPTRSLQDAAVGLLVAVLFAGCASKVAGLPTTLPDRENRLHKGYVFYLDGAGGGTAENNWAGGVKDGMLEGGYTGAGEMISWESGDGLLADQTASVATKRTRADELTEKLLAYRQQHPDAPVHILGFSAGTGEAIYGLEALPADEYVANVVLLGASFSHDYDLTQALRRVRGKLYFFTSKHDHMIGLATRLSGTTDRKKGDPSIGIDGPILPPTATDETRRLYTQKIVVIPHSEEMKEVGNHGHHFDNVKKDFIRKYVAPLLAVE